MMKIINKDESNVGDNQTVSDGKVNIDNKNQVEGKFRLRKESEPRSLT